MDLTTPLLAMISGVSLTLLTHYLTVKLERQKKAIDTTAHELSQLRMDISMTIKEIMLLIHEISWTTWTVVKVGKSKEVDYLDAYNQSARPILSQISEKLAVVGARNIDAYDILRAQAEEVFKLDVDLANALVGFGKNKLNADDFEDLQKRCSVLEEELPFKMKEAMNSKKP